MGLQSTITSLGALFPAGCVAAGMAVWCWARLNRLLAAVLAVCFFGAVLTATGLKLLAVDYAPTLGDAGLWRLSQGAPSGHSACASLVYGCGAVLFWRVWRNNATALAGFVACLATIGAVCVTRFTLHHHTIADVAGGVGVGLSFVLLFERALRTQLRPTEAKPGGLIMIMAVIALLALASGVRISSTDFL